MTPGIPSAQRLADLDAWRSLPAEVGTHAREWSHFVVFMDDGGTVLFNFSLIRRELPAGPSVEPRVTALVHDADGRWHGGVEGHPVDDFSVGENHVDVRIAHSSLILRGLTYDVRVQGRELRAHVAFEVQSDWSGGAALLAPDRDVNWFMVPVLRAHGWIDVNGTRRELRGQWAYHDHNWGQFGWGVDLAWDWGHGVDLSGELEDGLPRAVTWLRVKNGACVVTHEQSLMLWRRGRLHRLWHGQELEAKVDEGGQTARPVYPPAMRLVSVPGTRGLPTRFGLSATGQGRILDYQPQHGSAIALPSDERPNGMVHILETLGNAQVTTGAESRRYRCIGEFVRGQ